MLKLYPLLAAGMMVFPIHANPTVHFADITDVTYQSAKRATMDVQLRVSNPNPRSYTVSSLQARVLLDGRSR